MTGCYLQAWVNYFQSARENHCPGQRSPKADRVPLNKRYHASCMCVIHLDIVLSRTPQHQEMTKFRVTRELQPEWPRMIYFLSVSMY